MLKNITLKEIIDEVMPILEAHEQKTKPFVPSFLAYDVYDAKHNRVYPTHHWSQLKETKQND
jgi:hypothetical protein